MNAGRARLWLAATGCLALFGVGMAIAGSGVDTGRWWTCGWGCGDTQKWCPSLEYACCCAFSGPPITSTCSCMDENCNELSNCQVGY